MKFVWCMALMVVGADACAAQKPSDLRPGDTFELRLDRETAGEGSDGSSSSSTDRDMIVERIVAVRDDGLELEYDLPADTKAEDKAADWQFPVKVFKPLTGPPQLLNRPELEARIEGWLKAAKWTREACGHWIFTWNAFYIECNPDAALKTIEAFDLNSVEAREGAPYQERKALGPAPLVRKAAGANGATFAALLKLDPDVIRRERAESDLVVGEIMKQPVTLEAALQKRASDEISGTILVTFDTDSAGKVKRRTKVIKIETKKADGVTETETVTETLDRRSVSRTGS